MITKLELKEFTGFSELGIDFSPKINVIIGENGTGKTHLLKAAYALCSGSSVFKRKTEVSKEDIETVITSNLVRIFMPLDEKLGKMRRHGATDNTIIEAKFLLDKSITISLHTNSKLVAIQKNDFYEQYNHEPVFIPTKEVLSFMKGFNSLYEKYGLSFDQTYQDVCLLLDLPEVHQELLNEKSKWAMDEIKRICGGRFVFYGGGKVTFKSGNNEYSANIMAEGFRKVGMLSRLLETGAIQPGISGPLFWDEPEANLNPKLMRQLVQILLELSRNGQQIILASHNYILIKWFDLLRDKGKEDHVRFHALYRDGDSGEIKVESKDDYLEVSPNSIADTFSDLTDHDISRRMGGLGK